MRYHEIISETRMPAGVIRHKQRLAALSNEELKAKLAGKSDEQLKSLAWSHGYGRNSTHYIDRIAKANLSEGSADNFTIDDIKQLEKMGNLPQMKDFAKKLIATPSQRPMKPQKVAWFNYKIDSFSRPEQVIKLMYDLLLGGEGQGVIGQRRSTEPSRYRSAFGG